MSKLIGSLHRFMPGSLKRVPVTALALAIAATAVPAVAQDTLAEARIRRMEAEIRAMQRQVFPGSSGENRVFSPEITRAPTPGAATATPASTPVTDLLTRMDSVEGQLARLTSQIELNSNRLTQLEARAGIGAAAAAPTDLTSGTSTAPATTATPAPMSTPATQSNLNAMSGSAATPRPTPTPTPRPATAAVPSAQRVAAVRAIEKPQTGDAGDDEYSYGFRLWEAKFYPEAQQQLKLYVDKYPSHSRISFGRNLLGRAFLDDGKPRDAATWFLQNFQRDKNGARAPDSLIMLAEAMKQIKDTNRACIALAEFRETYAAEAAGRLKAQYDAARAGVTCK